MSKNASNAARNTPEGLELIAGIGPKTAEALAQIGVRDFADLAQWTPEALTKALFDQVGLRVWPGRIEAMNWIGQAQALLQQNPVADRMPVEMQAVEDLSDKTQWPQQAGFLLFFDFQQNEDAIRSWRTRVYHHETGAEAQFPGTAPHPWVAWILRQAEVPAAAETDLSPLAVPTSGPDLTSSAIILKILDVDVEEQSQPGVSGKKLVAQIQFTVSSPSPETVATDSAPCQILVLAVDQNRGVTKLIASEHGLFHPGQAVNTHRLEFPIPDVGRYELQAIVLVQGQIELMADYRGPTVTVIP